MLPEKQRLLDDAEQATGFSDWGGDEYFESSFHALFAAMVDSLQTDAQLHEGGLRGAELRLRAMAESRLRFIDDRKRWPAIAVEPIVKPVFILGLPRAGSTFLHSLMMQDPANRVPLTWEMNFPSPPPEATSDHDDPRIERSQQMLNAMGLGGPAVTSLHPFGAREPEECHLLMEHMALGDNLPGLWRLTSYNKVRARIDLREGYLTHRMVLQNLQHHHKGARVVLKNPGHLFYLEHLLAVYPDAQIIQTHRDPAKVIPSVTALLAAMRRVNSDAPIDEGRIAQGNLRAFAAGLERAMVVRRQTDVDSHFHDVHFLRLVNEPMATVRQIYQRFGLPLSDEVVARMERWLASSDSHSAKAKFSLADFGLHAAQIDAAFGNYITHYGVAHERRAT